jgi:hypothetical protein
MTNKPRFAMALLATTVALAIGTYGFAEENTGEALRRPVSGTFNDYVWVETGSGAGAWHVTGEWTARVKADSGKGEFTGSLLGVRSDLWVLETLADPANPALRTPHTHHVGLLDAEVTVIPNGIRFEGTAIITANGSAALYSNSTVRVDITGGSLIRYSNIKLTFFGAAVEHFGPQPYDGLVVIGR